MKDIFSNEERAIGSYRKDVSSLIPRATKVAWALKNKDIQKDQPGMTRARFLYNISRSSYEKNWGRDYQKPPFFDEFIAVLYRLLPKIGPLRILKLRTPTPEAEKLFEASFNAAMEQYRELLKSELTAGRVELPNDNFDLGVATDRGQYWLCDRATAQLMDRLARDDFAGIPPQLRADLLRFYAEPAGEVKNKLSAKARYRLEMEVEQLRQTTPALDAASKSALNSVSH